MISVQKQITLITVIFFAVIFEFIYHGLGFILPPLLCRFIVRYSEWVLLIALCLVISKYVTFQLKRGLRIYAVYIFIKLVHFTLVSFNVISNKSLFNYIFWITICTVLLFFVVYSFSKTKKNLKILN